MENRTQIQTSFVGIADFGSTLKQYVFLTYRPSVVQIPDGSRRKVAGIMCFENQVKLMLYQPDLKTLESQWRPVDELKMVLRPWTKNAEGKCIPGNIGGPMNNYLYTSRMHEGFHMLLDIPGEVTNRFNAQDLAHVLDPVEMGFAVLENE
jgi:hypothetical protein